MQKQLLYCERILIIKLILVQLGKNRQRHKGEKRVITILAFKFFRGVVLLVLSGYEMKNQAKILKISNIEEDREFILDKSIC